MRPLRVVEALSDSPAFAQHHRLRLPKAGDVYSLGEARGDGKFGDVWTAEPSEPRSDAPALVVKELKENVSLARRVIALQEAITSHPDRSWPERLLAFPFSVVLADFEGDEREAIFMLDLGALGYEDAEPHFEPDVVETHQRRPVHERVEFAHSYARGAATLEEIRFLHGDQNIPNLMLNPETLDAQIVDLDAGAVVVTGGERSRAEGKGDDCTPPEAKVPTPSGFDLDISLWDLDAERWAVGILIGHLAFGITPTYLFTQLSASVVAAYAEEGPWPRIDLQAPYAQLDLEPIQKYWQPTLEAAPGRMTETFVRFFKAGTRGAERPTAQEWVDALEEARRKPRFISVEVDPPVAPEGTEVVISWEAEGAEYVEHPDLGKLPATGEETLVVERSARHTLTAVNYYGRDEVSTGVVRVVPLPKLTSIPLAGFPGLELQATIATAAPPRPVPGFPPRLAQLTGVPAASPKLPQGPRPSPPPPHFGQLFKPISVSRRIRTLMRKGPIR